MPTETKGTQGKSANQKLKTYLVMQYLLRNTDERHPAQMQDILEYLREECGIEAERRSVYRDIEDINKILYMLDRHGDDDECTILDAEEALDEDEGEKFVVSGGTNRSGYHVCRRPYGVETDDVRLLAECIYNARFISEGKAADLIKIVRGLVSQWDAEEIEHDAFLVDRVKTKNTSVLSNVMTINYAMRRGTAADPHIPEKISFKYQKYTIQDVNRTVDRRKGERYTVSPYRILINDGNYYLLAFDDYAQDMRTYRIDRMKAVRGEKAPRDGEDVFRALDLSNYTQRVFGMMGGKKVRLTLRFINPLLDTVIERFGTKDVHYSKVDDTHFSVDPEVELSDQFFAWLCGFGNRVKIIGGPEDAIQQFRDYLDKIRDMY